MSDPPIPNDAKRKAEASIKRQALLGAAASNRQADEEAKIAEADKTTRLRAQRLAKEQADEIAASVAKSQSEPKPKRKR